MERINKFLTCTTSTKEADESENKMLIPSYGQYFTIAASHGYDIKPASMNICRTDGTNKTVQQTVSEPSGSVVLPNEHIEPFQHYFPSLQYALHKLQPLILSIPGSTIEDNRYSVSFHYRNVPVILHPRMETVLTDWLKMYNEKRRNEKSTGPKPKYYPLELRPGKLVWEIRPAVDWGKGHAVMYILKNIYQCIKDTGTGPTVVKNRNNHCNGNHPEDQLVVPRYSDSVTRTTVICIGDDHTDEDMFRGIREAEQKGMITKAYPILVHSYSSVDTTATTVVTEGSFMNTVSSPVALGSNIHSMMPISRSTYAKAYLNDPTEVSLFLRQLLQATKE